MSNIEWAYSSSTYIAQNNGNIQIGSKNNPQTSNWTIQTPISNFGQSIKITAISITAYTTATTATYDISVNGSSVKSGSLTTSSKTYSVSNLSITSGDIVITLKGSNNSKAMYLSSITVTYETGSTPTTLYLGQEMELFWNPARRFAVFGTPPVASLLVPFKRGQCFFLRAEAILLCGLPFLRGVPVGRRVWNFNFVRKTLRFLEPHPSRCGFRTPPEKLCSF